MATSLVTKTVLNSIVFCTSARNRAWVTYCNGEGPLSLQQSKVLKSHTANTFYIWRPQVFGNYHFGISKLVIIKICVPQVAPTQKCNEDLGKDCWFFLASASSNETLQICLYRKNRKNKSGLVNSWHCGKLESWVFHNVVSVYSPQKQRPIFSSIIENCLHESTYALYKNCAFYTVKF